MGRHLRYLPPEGSGLAEVTCRTVQGRYLPTSSNELNEIILGALGRAQQLYPVGVCSFAFVPDHFHLALRVEATLQLSLLMGHFNSNLAREAGRIVRWLEKFLGRRYQAIPISDEEAAQVERLRYALRDAVWQDRKASLVYRDLEGRASEPEVAPYGLVIKADRWYLVAGAAKGPAVFRGARVLLGVRLLDETFTRPPGLDLALFWRQHSQQFLRQMPSYPVTLRLTRDGEAALCRVRPAADGERLASVAWGADGCKVATLDFERQSIAVAQLVTLIPGVEALAPPELRQRLAEMARNLEAVYGRPPDRRA